MQIVLHPMTALVVFIIIAALIAYLWAYDPCQFEDVCRYEEGDGGEE